MRVSNLGLKTAPKMLLRLTRGSTYKRVYTVIWKQVSKLNLGYFLSLQESNTNPSEWIQIEHFLDFFVQNEYTKQVIWKQVYEFYPWNVTLEHSKMKRIHKTNLSNRIWIGKYLLHSLFVVVTVGAVGNCLVAVVAVGLPSFLLVRLFWGCESLGWRVAAFNTSN